jgi:hypothetical protein
MKTSLLDLGYEFSDTIQPDRSINSREYAAVWAVYNVSSGLGTAYCTMANAIAKAMSILKNEKLIAWTKSHVAYLQEQRYSPALPTAQAEWQKIQAWAA